MEITCRWQSDEDLTKHNIVSTMIIGDASSGVEIVLTCLGDARFDALGGLVAVNAEKAGVTQSVRIIERLAEVRAYVP